MAISPGVSQGKSLILGFGSDALSDDGLPVRLVHDLKSSLNPDKFDFETSPVGGLELLELLKGYETAILIDTQLTGRRKPGEISVFTPENFEETFHLSSQHDLSFHEALRLAKEMAIPFPADIQIIAIEIIENKRLSFEFSEEIKVKYPSIIDRVNSFVLSGLTFWSNTSNFA
jgi:hydrogenase maturation protease